MIMDDEHVWCEYAKAALIGVIGCPNRIKLEGTAAMDEVVVKIADKMLERHKVRFPQAKFS